MVLFKRYNTTPGDEDGIYVCTNAVPKAMTLQEIQAETEKDSTLQSLIKAIETDRWTDPEILDYKRLKDELLVYSGVVLRGNRIVVPSKLRERAVELAHVGHQGIVKTKRLIREKVWFPGIDKMVKDKIDNCLACQAVTPSESSRIEPLQMTPLPSGPWKMLAMDFLGPFPSGDYLLVVIDEYSRFPEVEIVKSTSVNHTSTRSKRNSRFPCSRREHGVNKSDLCLTCGGFIQTVQHHMYEVYL